MNRPLSRGCVMCISHTHTQKVLWMIFTVYTQKILVWCQGFRLLYLLATALNCISQMMDVADSSRPWERINYTTQSVLSQWILLHKLTQKYFFRHRSHYSILTSWSLYLVARMCNGLQPGHQIGYLWVATFMWYVFQVHFKHDVSYARLKQWLLMDTCILTY